MVPSQNDALHHVTSPDATRIAYWTSGVRHPLLLVHGSVSDHHRFATLLPHLTPHAQVRAMDRRGRGASGDSDAYAFEREVDDVVAVIEAAAIATGEPVDVYGHSLGAVFTLAGTLPCGGSSSTSRRSACRPRRQAWSTGSTRGSPPATERASSSTSFAPCSR